jgi:hypothetical protein
LLDFLSRIVIDATSTIQDHQRRRWIHDEYNAAPAGDGYSNRAGWVEQQPDGTWRAFGSYYSGADLGGERSKSFFVTGATEQEVMDAWQRAYGYLDNPSLYDRPDGVEYSGGASWVDDSGVQTLNGDATRDSWNRFYDETGYGWRM